MWIQLQPETALEGVHGPGSALALLGKFLVHGL